MNSRLLQQVQGTIIGSSTPLVNARTNATLGTGGFAKVKTARLTDGTLVAVKPLPLSPTALREAETLKTLSHPNIITYLGQAVTYGTINIYMELAKGSVTDLVDQINKQQRGSHLRNDINTLGLLKQLSNGLTYIHEQGIIHRDLKPENLLYFETATDLYFKIADFGISKTVNSWNGSYCTGKPIGTTRYMAPELFSVLATYTKASDVWALGAVLYFWMSGQHLFQGNSEAEIIRKIINFTGISNANPNSLLSQMLSPASKQRPTAAHIKVKCNALIDQERLKILLQQS